MINVTDLTSRPPISAPIKDSIKLAFLDVPEGKASALLAIYDIKSNTTRLHFAWKANDVWKVGAQIGWAKDTGIEGSVSVQAAW